MNRRSFVAGLSLSPLVACAAPAFAEKSTNEHLKRVVADSDLATRLRVPVSALDHGAVFEVGADGKLSIHKGTPVYDPREA
jgi:hypothetical protein